MQAAAPPGLRRRVRVSGGTRHALALALALAQSLALALTLVLTLILTQNKVRVTLNGDNPDDIAGTARSQPCCTATNPNPNPNPNPRHRAIPALLYRH